MPPRVTAPREAERRRHQPGARRPERYEDGYRGGEHHGPAHPVIDAAEVRSKADFACAAVTHSSKFRRVTYTRKSVRTIASVINHAWWASKVTASAMCDAASTRSVPTAREVAAF